MRFAMQKCCAAVGIALALNGIWVPSAFAWPEEGRAAIVPTLVNVATSKSLQFHAIQLPRRMQVARPATQVTWTVNGVPGGNDTFGHVDSNGLYRAPNSAPAPSAVHVGAEVPESSNRMLYATVLLSDSPRYHSDFARSVGGSYKEIADRIDGYIRGCVGPVSLWRTFAQIALELMFAVEDRNTHCIHIG